MKVKCVCVCLCSCQLAKGGMPVGVAYFKKGDVVMGVAYFKKMHTVQMGSQTCTRFSGKVGREPEDN